MGQKVNPHGLRVGVIKDWDSKWYASKKEFADFLIEDNQLRKYIKKRLFTAGISKIKIERAANSKVKITVYTAKPGVVIGKGGAGIDTLKKDLEKMISRSVVLNVTEIRRPELDAQLAAESIAFALEKRIAFRRAMKQTIGRAMKAGAKGIKVMTAGRLGGAEMARTEMYSEGRVPLHTIRADINYGFAEANTTYGKLGIKVWLNKGDFLGTGFVPEIVEAPRSRSDRKPKRRNDSDRAPRRNNK